MATTEALLALVQNISILLAAILIFDLFPARGRLLDTLPNRLVLGVVLGVLVVVIMLTPWKLAPGVVFDTRSVLIGVSGLFFGTLPTVLCMVMSAAYRLYQGGQGALTGVSVILASGCIGVAWRYARKRPLHDISWGELFLFGLAVHVAMLLLMFTLPLDVALSALSRITLPVLLVYPAGTALTGTLLAKRLRIERVREDLAESETLFRKLFEDHAAVKLILDPETGRIMDANHAAAAFYGWSRERLREMRIQEINTLPPGEVRTHLARAMGQEQLRFEFRHRLADGSARDVEVLSGVIRHKGRMVLHSIVHDISDRKRMEQEFLRAKEQAEAANRAKSEFLAIMSHEIRTPLSAVIGMVDLAMAGETDPTRRDCLVTASDSARHLLTIVTDLLDFSKIEAGKLVPERVHFDLHEAVESAARTFSFQARQHGLELTVDIDPGAPRFVLGDPGRLRQVLVNLVGNAIKFTDQGFVRVEVRPVDPGRAGVVAARILVKDSGIGIPPDKIDSVFEQFTQAEGSISRRYGGTGLGLAICRRLVELMGGSIGVESVEGQGSTFFFNLVLEPGDQRLTPESGEAEEAEEAGGKLKILLVEDNPVNVKVASLHLTQMGHDLVAAPDGAEALKLLSRERFDAVLMDLEMPGMDGLEVTRRIRSGDTRHGRPLDPLVPIVAMTAHAQDDIRKQCLTAGMDDYMTKPVNFFELEALISRLLIRPESEALAGQPPLFDKERAMRRMGIDEATLAPIFQAALDEFGERLDDLLRATKRGDIQTIRTHCHTLKSICGTIGFAQGQGILEKISEAARNADIKAVRHEVRELGRLFGLGLAETKKA
ncbi:MAG TPA: hypothetical protein DDW80_01640 [Desulfovibrio sp.]|nr:hypothetical protein [Desulfovibrio sp.]